ncbi:MAG: hypothetical protein ACE37N_03985 [Pseudohongiellaceae bacterium]
MTEIRRKPISMAVAVATVTMLSGSALAQQGIEEIVVSASPIRDSQMAAPAKQCLEHVHRCG